MTAGQIPPSAGGGAGPARRHHLDRRRGEIAARGDRGRDQRAARVHRDRVGFSADRFRDRAATPARPRPRRAPRARARPPRCRARSLPARDGNRTARCCPTRGLIMMSGGSPASRARVMRSCMMLNASTMTLESPGRLAVPRMRRLAVFSAPNSPNRPRLATSSSIGGSGSAPRSGIAVPRPNRSVLTLTAITRRAPSARATETGTGLTSAPSTSQRSPSRTGGKMPGSA